ncbi:MAG: hypothetical protein V4712_17745 [Pseudomonadota bacterium]
MSLHDCLQRAIDDDALPPARARRAQALYAERLTAHASLGQGAEAMAAEDVWVFLRKEAIRKRRGAYMQASAQMNVADALARHRDADGQPNAASALRQFVEWGQSATHQSVSSVREALSMSYMRDVSDLILAHKRNKFTGAVRQRARLNNVVRELKGEATGDDRSKSIAEAVRATLERARQEHNAAGGNIGKLEGYDLPHHWDRQLVGKVPEDQFVRDMTQQMDWERIVDRDTDLPFSQSTVAARDAFLKTIHARIKSGGWSNREPAGVTIGSSLGNSRADPRVLHFKTADGWLAMNDKYGTADPFSAIVEHLQAMARDTAIMRILGPNPYATLEYGRQAALKLATDRPWKPNKSLEAFGKGLSLYSTPEAEVKAVASHAGQMLDLITGAANQPEMDLFAHFMSAKIRPMLVASQLGGAILSAVTDVGFMGMASRHVGIDPKRTLARHFKTLVSADNRALLVRAGIIAESMAATGVSQARLMGEAMGPGIWQHLSEFTMRASGLTAWTDIARGVSQLEFYGFLADNTAKSWDQINPWLRDNALATAGITADEWDVIRKTDLFRHPQDADATFLIPDDIRKRTDLAPDVALDLSLKLGAAIQNQKEFFVPNASLRARAAWQKGQPGTAGGELARSALMYKNFPLTLMQNQLGRVLYQKVRGTRFTNILMFGMITTLGGAMASQFKEVAKGRDLRDMTDPKFWWSAVLQGGGLGLFGDFLYSTENRFGGGWATSLAGPPVAFADRVGGLGDTFYKALTSRDPEDIDKAQREAIRFANQFSGPTNLWYLNTAFDRLVWDNLQEWLDGGAAKAWSQAEKRRVKEFGNPAYWPQGQALPSRLPNLSNATGAAP